jgi:predicted acetyltransferase
VAGAVSDASDTPGIVLRPAEASELGAYWDVAATAFGWQDPSEDMGEWLGTLLGPARSMAAFEGDAIVGVAGAFPFRMTVPGGEVDAAGVTLVGVLPSHRRRGILTRLIGRLLHDASAAGEPVAYLWASEDQIYQRFGFGMGAFMADLSIERHRTAFVEDSAPAGRVRLLAPTDAVDVMGDLYERYRRETPGAFARTRVWWERHRLRDPAGEREGGSRLRAGVWELDGEPRGYAIWRVRPDWEQAVPSSRLHVYEAVGLDPLATREIWRFLFGIDLVGRIVAHHLPSDHPLPYLMAEPRRLGLRLNWPLWVRVVDVKGALEARAWPVDDEVVIEVTDRFRPVNQGCWRLVARDGVGKCERTDDAPDLRLTANDLGAAYLGSTPVRGLAMAGRVTELTEGAVARADALFRWHRAAWCPEIF